MTTDLRSTLTAADPAPTDTYDDAWLTAVARHLLAEAENTSDDQPRRTTRRRILVALPIAAALALGLAVAPALLGGDRTGASADAATLLNQAADAIVASDPPARADQYWRIDSDATGLGVSVAFGGGVSEALIGRTTTSYVAVDGSRPTYTVAGAEHVIEQLSGAGPTLDGPATRSEPAPNDTQASWQQPTPAFLAALPRDADALEARLRKDSAGEGRSADGEVFVFVADVLRSGLVPADLRQTIYRVLAETPGVTVADRAVTIGDGTGVAFARDETTDGSRQEIVVDPATGELVGEREVLVDGTEYIPAGTVTDETSTLRTLVDAVPAEVVAAAR